MTPLERFRRDQMVERITSVGRGSRKFFRGASHLVSATAGGLMGLARESSMRGNGMFAGSAYYAMDAARNLAKFGGQALGSGTALMVGGTYRGLKGYNNWRRGEIARMNSMKALADAMPYGPAPKGSFGGMDLGDIRNKYATQPNGYRRFGMRSPGEHLQKGAQNMFSPKHGLLSPLSMGLTLGISAAMSSDDIMDPKNGLAKHIVGNIGGEIGFTSGMGIGAAAMSAMIPGAGLAIGAGMLAGGVLGGLAGFSVATLPWKMSEFGNKYGRRSVAKRSQFIDSEYAATMRQRAMSSIYRSQMNARSAFGQEALALHG